VIGAGIKEPEVPFYLELWILKGQNNDAQKQILELTQAGVDKSKIEIYLDLYQ